MKSINNYLDEKLTLNSQTKLSEPPEPVTKTTIKDFVNNYLSNASIGHIKVLQKELSQWYVPSEIDKRMYEIDSSESYVKDLMEYTAKKLNITFEKLWEICNHSSFLFRSIISKQNPYR